MDQKLLARGRTIFAPLFLGSGAALLIFVASGVSLLAALGLVCTLAFIVGGIVWRKLTVTQRADLRTTIGVGFMTGLIATAAYDAARFLLIELTGIAFWPFDIFNVFGRALFGQAAQGSWVTAAGVAYHFTNGISFAIAYTILLGRRGILAGIGWALLLELFMVSVYPGWLGLKALNEFLQVSIFGHLVYGSVVGGLAKYLLDRKELRT